MTVHSWVQSNFPIYFDSELGCGPVLDELHIKNVLCCLLRPQNSRHVCLSCPESQQQLDGHIYQSKSSRYPSFTYFSSVFVWTELSHFKLDNLSPERNCLKYFKLCWAELRLQIQTCRISLALVGWVGSEEQSWSVLQDHFYLLSPPSQQLLLLPLF